MTNNFVYNPPLIPFLDILYEDSDIMVVNKPSGLLSVPGRLKEYHDSVLSRVRSMYEDAFAVHRLDLGTSGILVVGLNKKAISNLGKQFMQRTVKKVYMALVDGDLKGSDIIDLPMRTDIDNRPYQIIDFEHGKRAVTYYESLYTKDNRTLVRLYPITGRSHQLRVHLKEIGHPILGDHLYAPEDVFKSADFLYLHACALQFEHPISNKRLSFCTDPAFDIDVSFKPKTSWLEKDLNVIFDIDSLKC